ncbi:hypothetical protein [Apilactobacillus micheneri]|uniref:hypothetical protein n=1 Tax=Apilactobacillus micheneri TaxID=1899430 RepID=UPI000D04777C|nr:hypothetical protein [Apilactobacillus micheneri]TPR37192.1 hypothetical protein DY116_03600 [Apilactobacillus micheneri]TPR39736.1 hypothetical protein DY119_03970 [Apilactobacillus micheneri]
MKKFNKASLVIAPMALMLFSSSLNIPKVMADNNGSWSEQEQINQQNKYNQELVNKYKNYTTKELYEYLSKVESTIPSIINGANDGFKKALDSNYNNEKNTFNSCKSDINNFDLDNKSKVYSTNSLNNWIIHYHGNNDINNRIKDLTKVIDSSNNDSINDEQLEQIKNIKSDYLNFLDSSINNLDNKYQSDLNNLNKEIDKDKEYSNNALSYATKYQQISKLSNDIISTKNIDDIKNVLSDYNFATNNIKSYQYAKNDINTTNNLRELESYLMRTYIDESNKSSISLDDEIDNLKNQINSINNKSNNSYIPVSNNSNVNNNNDALKNELNNAKNNINNIINKNVELSNTTSSLKNEIETLKKQVHELKNNKRSKNKNTKANKRTLNQKKKELNKVNKELKKHIRKSNKKKLIQKRNSILKSIKKLNK